MTDTMTTRTAFMERVMSRSIIAILAFVMALCAISAAPAAAQTGEFCSKFDSGQDGWGPCQDRPNVIVNTTTAGGESPGDSFLQITDLAGQSAACNTDANYTGNWLKRFGGCAKFCFDFKVFDAGSPPPPFITPQFTIFSGTSKATFYANTVVPNGDHTWHTHICAPIAGGSSPPSSPDGHWVVQSGTWNSIITNVTSVLIPVDFTSSPSEVVGYDNICLTRGDCSSATLKVCKVAGIGIAVGTPFTFTVGGNTITVPAGAAPGGNCVEVKDPKLVPGSNVTVTENIPSGDAVSSIVVDPTTGLVGTPNLGAGTVTVRLDKGATEVTYTNTHIPPPEPTNCWKDAKVSVTCNKDGTYTVTVSNIGQPGDVITLGSTTPGVSVSPPQQNWAPTTTWTISGATPGQTVVLTANDTKIGGGDKPGTDQCCSGEIKIVMPDCPKGEVVVEKKVKNNTNATPALINSLVFPIGLTCTTPANLNVSFGLNNGGTHIENNVPYGSNCTVTEQMSTLPPPPKGVCPPNGIAYWKPAQITPSSATVNSPVTAFTVVNELDCKYPLLDVDLGIKKTGATTPAQQPFYVFDLTVTNVGGAINNAGAIVVTDTVPPNMTFNTIGGAGWTCVPPGGPAGTIITCTYSGPPVASGQVLTPIHVDATATGSAPYPPVTNCATVGVTPTSGLTDTNASNNNSCVTVSKPVTCQPPMVMNAAGVCACPPPMVPGAVPGQCMCPPGTVQEGKECVKLPPPPVCQPPMVPGPVPGSCICGDGLVLRHGKCVKRITCRAPFIPNASGTSCVCRDHLVRRGRRCVEPVVCHPPARLNRRGTACLCPHDMEKRGNRCVERKRLRINPDDVIRVLPGLIPYERHERNNRDNNDKGHPGSPGIR